MRTMASQRTLRADASRITLVACCIASTCKAFTCAPPSLGSHRIARVPYQPLQATTKDVMDLFDEAIVLHSALDHASLSSNDEVSKDMKKLRRAEITSLIEEMLMTSADVDVDVEPSEDKVPSFQDMPLDELAQLLDEAILKGYQATFTQEELDAWTDRIQQLQVAFEAKLTQSSEASLPPLEGFENRLRQLQAVIPEPPSWYLAEVDAVVVEDNVESQVVQSPAIVTDINMGTKPSQENVGLTDKSKLDMAKEELKEGKPFAAAGPDKKADDVTQVTVEAMTPSASSKEEVGKVEKRVEAKIEVSDPKTQVPVEPLKVGTASKDPKVEDSNTVAEPPSKETASKEAKAVSKAEKVDATAVSNKKSEVTEQVTAVAKEPSTSDRDKVANLEKKEEPKLEVPGPSAPVDVELPKVDSISKDTKDKDIGTVTKPSSGEVIFKEAGVVSGAEKEDASKELVVAADYESVDAVDAVSAVVSAAALGAVAVTKIPYFAVGVALGPVIKQTIAYAQNAFEEQKSKSGKNPKPSP